MDDDDETYRGVPLSELQINAVDWTQAAEHIRTRTLRYSERPEFDVEPEWASQATLDARRLVATTSGESLEVIGRSDSAPRREDAEDGEVGRILKAWIVPLDLEEGIWEGASACDANQRARKAYKEAQQ